MCKYGTPVSKRGFVSRPEPRVVMTMGLVLLILFNYFISEIVKSGENQRLQEVGVQSVLNKQLVDESMNFMFHSIHLQRAWIEERLTQIEAESANSWLLDKLEYDRASNLSTLDKIEPQDDRAYGNLIVKGNIGQIDLATRNKMESLSGLFDMQKFIQYKGIRNSWSTYFSPSFIMIFPFKEGIATMDGEDTFFTTVESSLVELNKPENKVLYETGWDVGMGFDITGTVLMFSKYLPVKSGDIVVGAVCDNIAVEDIESIITPISGAGMYLVDSAGNVVYNNRDHITEIMTWQSVLSQKYQFASGIDVSAWKDGVKHNGYYYFVNPVDQIDWKFIYVVPSSAIEINPAEKFALVLMTNSLILLGVLFSLWLLFRYHKKSLEIDRQKDQFLMSVSHDLKSPLNSILGFNKLLENKFREIIMPELDMHDRQIDAAVRKILRNTDIVHSEGKRLTGLIDNLLDISVLEHMDQPFSYQVCDAERLIRESCEAVQSLAAEKGLELQVEIESVLEPVYADRERILQVLSNLLSNAIKFTDNGYVQCSAKRMGRDILFCIEDTGIGIPKGDFERIFDRFVRSGNTAREREGTGLGLAICKQIVVKHRGKIWTESIEGKGSKFYFTLPLIIGRNAHGETESRDCG